MGNPQIVGQKPLTFHRQVLSGVMNPQLIEDHPNIFPSDVVERIQKFLPVINGAYTHSIGHALFRKMVASYIEKRDKNIAPVDIETLFLTDGRAFVWRGLVLLKPFELTKKSLRNRSSDIQVSLSSIGVFRGQITEAITRKAINLFSFRCISGCEVFTRVLFQRS